MGKGQAYGLVVLRWCLGAFFLFQAISKIGWFASSAVLSRRLNEWLGSAGPWNRAYLETVCLPGVEFFARVVPTAEFAVAAAFLLGLYTRPAAWLSLLMVLNFHFAAGIIFHYSYLTNAYGLPVFGGLLALGLGGARLPLSVR